MFVIDYYVCGLWILVGMTASVAQWGTGSKAVNTLQVTWFGGVKKKNHSVR